MVKRVVEFASWVQNWKDFCLKINIPNGNYILNFENWSNGEVSKIGHHFRKLSDLKIDIIKNVLLNSYSSMKKKSERFR